jgi:hypothetical protein
MAMSGVGIQIEARSTGESSLRKLAADLNQPELKRAAGRAVANFLRDHFAVLESARSGKQMPGAATHYWNRVIRASVQAPKDVPGGVAVSVNGVGLMLHWKGGTVRPIRTQWLTIPARAEAYGKRAGEFDNLRFIKFRGDLAALVERESTDISFRRGKKGTSVRSSGSRGGGVMYWLKKSVTLPPDDSVIPSQTAISTIAHDAIERAIALIAQRRGS